MTVVGISGGTGSGKSTLTRAIMSLLGEDRQMGVLEQDSYYLDQSHLDPKERAAINFDSPEVVELDLLRTHIEYLRAGKAISVPTYDFTTHARRHETRLLLPSEMLLVDGILIGSNEQLRSAFDLFVYVETPADIRLARRMERDVRDRGRSPGSILSQYLATVRPMHDKFVEPYRDTSDIVVSGLEDPQEVAVRIIKLIEANPKSTR